MPKTKDLKRKMREKKPKETITPDMLLSTGSTILNLACSGNPMGGLAKGYYYLIVGDSSAGKTMLVFHILAEAAKNKEFDDYDLIYDSSEFGALFNVREFFGRKLSRRLKKPSRGVSETVEDMYYNLDDAYENYKKTGRKFIYIEDSMDSLTSKEDDTHFKKMKDARRKGTEAKGSYGATKAKFNSTSLRRMMTPLQKSGSMLIIVAQTRASFSMFAPKGRSGGDALTFYATLEIWLSKNKRLHKTVRNQKMPIGILSRMRVKKNRVKGKDRAVIVPIYESFKGGGGGIDDIGSCIDYLVKMKHWKQSKGSITATEFDFVGKKEKLIQQIEFDERYKELQQLVGRVWNEIEDECSVRRVKRYT